MTQGQKPTNSPAESWLDTAADLLDEAKVLRSLAESKERQAKRYVLLAEDWEREQKVAHMNAMDAEE